jgi:hypothetical protein
VEECAHFSWIEVEVVAAIVGFDKTKAVWMPDNPPGNQVALVNQAECMATVAHQLAIADHGAETALQCDLIVIGTKIQGLDDFVELHWSAMLGQGFEDELPAWDRILVLFRLTLEVWIEISNPLSFFSSCHGTRLLRSRKLSSLPLTGRLCLTNMRILRCALIASDHLPRWRNW